MRTGTTRSKKEGSTVIGRGAFFADRFSQGKLKSYNFCCHIFTENYIMFHEQDGWLKLNQ